MTLDPTRHFAPPGPGCWEIDAMHFPRPVTPFHAALFPGAMQASFREQSPRYGMLLEYLEFHFVNGFGYLCPRPVAAPKNATGAPPKLVFKLLLALHPAMRARVRSARTLATRKPWRADLALWDKEIKPAAIRAHLSLQAIDPTTLSQDDLLAHLDRCREHVRAMIRQHHRFTLTCMLPVGDFLAQAMDWTGLPATTILKCLHGASPISAGGSAELNQVTAALKSDADALTLLHSHQRPLDVLTGLRQRPGATGTRVNDYLERVSYRLIDGFDIGNPFALELPEMIVTGLKQAVAGDQRTELESLKAVTATVCNAVPEAHRPAFDELLADAREIDRLRDERGIYSEIWASGLARRAVLAAAVPLVQAGRLDKAEHLVEADYDEMRQLIGTDTGPSAADLAGRAHYRATATLADAPATLGPVSSGPPPLAWLPEATRRWERAVMTAISALFKEPEARSEAKVARGLAVSCGTYEGTARLVTSPADLSRIQKGDVLVTRSTSAAFNIVLPMLGAIVTDRGGALSHAAIVAREYGIPAVVGSRTATSLIPDGARVQVDGNTGEARVIG